MHVQDQVSTLSLGFDHSNDMKVNVNGNREKENEGEQRRTERVNTNPSGLGSMPCSVPVK